MLECVVNVSEGRDRAVIDRLAQAAAEAAGPVVLDVHTDPHHHRSVFTLAAAAGDADADADADERVEAGVRALATAALELIDLSRHTGVHPRIGVVDVVPFVSLVRVEGVGPLADGPIAGAERARDRFAAWAGATLALPCFTYGLERTLPEVRRTAWTTLKPAYGPLTPHPTAGAAAVGARPTLVAYNLWLNAGADLGLAKAVAAAIRGPHIRALGLQVGPHVQVSCNLIAPWLTGPGAAFDAVARAIDDRAGPRAGIDRAELVGLLPQVVLDAEPAARWAELDLEPSKSIEARLEQAGLDGGSFR